MYNSRSTVKSEESRARTKEKRPRAVAVYFPKCPRNGDISDLGRRTLLLVSKGRDPPAPAPDPRHSS